MFVRFRERNGRLLLSLIETRRVAGKVRQEHVADLGAIDLPASTDARAKFWPKLHDRLSRLGNRIGPDRLGPILDAINARIPMVPIEDMPAVNRARAERSLRWCRGYLEHCEEQVELHQNLKATVERKIETLSNEAVRARAGIQRAEAAIADPTQAPPAELTHKEAARILRAEGITKQAAYRMRKVADMTPQEFEEYCARRSLRFDRRKPPTREAAE
jgi:hypothetical protein